MAEYEKLINKIKITLEAGKEINVTARDIEHFTPAQIDNINNVIDEYSLNYIQESLQKGVIDEGSADVLSGIFEDSMETHRVLYKNITDTLLKEYRPYKLKKLEELGEEPAPEEINAINLDTGEVELNDISDLYPNHASKFKEYRPKHITPFTDMRLTFFDLRDNPIYVILPRLKNVRRAIDKIKRPVYDKKSGKLVSPGGKYFQEYQKEVKELRLKCGEDKAAFKAGFAKIKRPTERLMDVSRLTITRKYYMDTEETLELFSKDDKYGVNSAESKDAFRANKSVKKNSKKDEKYNEKNYRDKKIYLHLEAKGRHFVVEVQVKITKLYEGDIDTHAIYAGTKAVEQVNANNILISKQNTDEKGLRYWEERLNTFTNQGDRAIANMNIFRRKQAIQRRNKEVIRAYNLIVIDKAFRLEDAKLANGKELNMISYNHKTGEGEHVYSDVAKFITQNYLYRPFKAYDMSQAFSVSDEELNSLGLLINKEQVKEFTDRYSHFIIPKYIGIIQGDEKFPINQQKIEALFKKDAYNESGVRVNEEYEKSVINDNLLAKNSTTSHNDEDELLEKISSESFATVFAQYQGKHTR